MLPCVWHANQVQLATSVQFPSKNRSKSCLCCISIGGHLLATTLLDFMALISDYTPAVAKLVVILIGCRRPPFGDLDQAVM